VDSYDMTEQQLGDLKDLVRRAFYKNLEKSGENTITGEEEIISPHYGGIMANYGEFISVCFR